MKAALEQRVLSPRDRIAVKSTNIIIGKSLENASKPRTIQNMPEWNFCPRCGHELEWREKDDGRLRPVCLNCGYTHYANPGLAVGVLVTDEQNRVCLILRGEEPRKGYWGLPAGFMEGDESAEEGAIRECFEETGLRVELEGLFQSFSYRHADRKSSGVLLVYRARILGGAALAGTDTVDVKFFAAEEIPLHRLAFRTHIETLAKWGAKFNQGA